MLPLQTIMRRIRTRLHDSDSIAYDDEEILDVINCGIRFIRRTITNIRPSLLISTTEGILSAGTKSILLEKRPTKIIHVTAGDEIIKTEKTYSSDKIYHNYKKIFKNHDPLFTEVIKNFYVEKELHKNELAHLVKYWNDLTGRPTDFYLTGTKTINFFPIPERNTKYTILTVDDIEELSLKDDSPLNTEFDDFLIEYAATRLEIGNEYDVSQEQQVMSNIYSQIQQILMPPPAGVLTKGYW